MTNIFCRAQTSLSLCRVGGLTLVTTLPEMTIGLTVRRNRQIGERVGLRMGTQDSEAVLA